MRTIPTQQYLSKTLEAMQQTPVFKVLKADHLSEVANHGTLMQFDEGETLMAAGDDSDSFVVLLKGEVAVFTPPDEEGDETELAVLAAPNCMGEMGLLLGEPRTATIRAKSSKALVLSFQKVIFETLYQNVPAFGVAISRALAERVKATARKFTIPDYEGDADSVDQPTLGVLNEEFIVRHRVLPLNTWGNQLTVGFVDEPSPQLLKRIKLLLPTLEIKPQRVTAAFFEQVIAQRHSFNAPAGADDESFGDSIERHMLDGGDEIDLEGMLKRMVAEGASDLHLTGGMRPRWRVDGKMTEMYAFRPIGPEQVFDLFKPHMDEPRRQQFMEDNDADFAHEVTGLARFRVNLFRDNHGVGAVLRTIPSTILTVKQLGLPETILGLCDLHKGLVLVTGPTGSGKSTTLAAMVDYINRNHHHHVITLEDPIEFTHESKQSLINQREVGPHTNSFARALRAALREDPDAILVGELRDTETMHMAIETANTGHLVFGTLHTATAMGTVDRVIGMFSSEEQDQVRTMLTSTLKGVIAQTLCRKKGGGRVAAIEILITTRAMLNLIRKGKTHQLESAMVTGRNVGCRLLNDELARLVNEDLIELDEALSKAIDRNELAQKLGMHNLVEEE